MRQFNVIYWSFNEETPTPYDVLPYFRNEYERTKKTERPVTKEQWEKFIKNKGKYMYWARCEYEVIVSTWPPTDKSYKLDIWQQIEANLDLITEILMQEHESNGKPNTK